MFTLLTVAAVAVAPQTVYPLLSETRGPADCGALARGAGDFDADGLIDLWGESVHWNHGDGRFVRGPGSSVLNGLESVSWFLEVFDLEGDGDPDVFTGEDLNLLVNQGNGTFVRTTLRSLSGWDSVQMAHALQADLNADGVSDFVYSYLVEDYFPYVADKKAYLYLSQPGGGWNETLLVDALGPKVAIDVEPDGDLDVVGIDLSNAPYTWFVVRNDGAAFTRHALSSPGLPTALGPQFSNDYDADGDDDFVSADQLWLNDGGTSFSLGAAFPSGVTGVIGTGDVNGDGVIDLIGVNAADDVLGLQNDGGGVFTIVFTLPFAGGNPASAYYGDIDGDGDGDLIVDSPLTTYHQVGPQQYLEDLSSRTRRAEIANSPAVADIDADGDPDVYLGGNAFYVNDGTGFFERERSRVIGSFAPGQGARTFIDYDGDGDRDLFAGSNNPRMIENDGTGHFSRDTRVSLPSGLGADPAQVIAADLSGDGLEDLAVLFQGASDTLEIWENLGSGVFVVRAHPIVFSNAYRFDVGDVNGDGTLDVLAGETLWIRNAPWPATGSLPFLSVTVPAGFYSEHLADVDGDGDLDAVTGGAVYRNPGNGILAATPVAPTGACIDIGDLDGDGDPDLLTMVDFPVLMTWEENDGAGNFTLGGAHSYSPAGIRSLSPCYVSWNYAMSRRPALFDSDLDGDADLILGDDFLCNVARGLYVEGIPGTGQDLHMSVYGPPGTPYFIAFAESTKQTYLKYGRLFLDLSTLFLPVVIGSFDGTGKTELAFPVPSTPALVGTRYVGQALVGAPLRFSNADWFTFAD